MRKNVRRSVLAHALLAAAAAAIFPAVSRAEEGGSGHYQPGQTATFFDTLPSREGFTFYNDVFYYNGSITGQKNRLEFGGVLYRNVEATIYSDTPRVRYEGPGELFGADYAAEVGVPFVAMHIKGVLPAGKTAILKVSDGTEGLGDVFFRPLMLSWNHEDFKWGAMATVWAPTGNYAVGHLANIGKNYWTFEPGVSFSYLGSDNGIELTAFAGIDFNTPNNASHYHTGDQFHLDVALAKHMPLLGGDFAVGATGYYYEQFTRDRGSGVLLPKPEGRASGIGPVFTYSRKLRNVDTAVEFKWLPDITTNNRLNGDAFWLKLEFNF
ncbi:MAG: hypothetical protein JWO87_121 [Phycisphaerales bacterium]|nr:hypothetical protein [Phycisphaerales bacterium]MDB5298458.1 hypothetical protein [Phycisphaerales bacterium]